MRGLQLRSRLTIWFAGSILLILLPFLLGILALQWRSMRQALDHHLQEDLEVALEMLVRRGDDIAWRTEVEQDLGYDAGVQRWVEVYSPAGSTLYVRGLPTRGEIREALGPPARESRGYRTIRTPAGAAVRTLVTERPLGAEVVRVRVARSEDNLRDDLWRLGLVFGLAAPLAVFAAALAGHFISGRALAPLGRMADRARSISAEHLSERLPVENSSDELGQLAMVFNETFARLDESFARLKQFTADASHELRTPLTAIRSVGEVGLREARSVQDYQEIVGSMLEESDRLSHVVETLLTLSRWESGRVRPVADHVDLDAMARDISAQLTVLAEDEGRRDRSGPRPASHRHDRRRHGAPGPLQRAGQRHQVHPARRPHPGLVRQPARRTACRRGRRRSGHPRGSARPRPRAVLPHRRRGASRTSWHGARARHCSLGAHRQRRSRARSRRARPVAPGSSLAWPHSRS